MWRIKLKCGHTYIVSNPLTGVIICGEHHNLTRIVMTEKVDDGES